MRVVSFYAFIVASAVAMPKMPPAYKLIIEWTSGGGYEYIDEEAFDLTNQKHSTKAIESNSVVSILVEQPKVDGLRYFDDLKLKTCQKTNIKGTVLSGIIPYYPTAKNETTEVVQGINCDKWTMDLGTYTISVWFIHNGNTPVQMYNSNDEKTGAVKGGIKQIRCYFPGVDWDSFAIPAVCTKTPAQIAVSRALQAKQATVVPTLPRTMSYKMSWQSTQAGRSYQYAHYQYYNLDKQMHRDNQLEGSCNIVATTVELPKEATGGEGYHYDDKTLECEKYPFTGIISDGILTYADSVLEKTESVNGVEANKWTKVFPPYGKNPGYNQSVWFTTGTNPIPVQIYNSIDVPPMGVIDGGIKHITYFSDVVKDSIFAIPSGCNKQQ
jgi:hypothetical protein